MKRRYLLPAILIVGAILTGSAAAQDGLQSGPQKGEMLPGAFHPHNISGKLGVQRNEKGELVKEGQYHCLVTDYALKPVVLIFAREPKGGKEGPLLQLLKRVDDTIKKDQSGTLRSFVVFLSPDAVSSVTEALVDEDKRTKEPEKLVEEAIRRQELTERLEKLTGELKPEHVVITDYPEPGPPGYKIADKAEVTVILYHKYKVVANHAFAEGQLGDAQIEEVIRDVNDLIGRGKKEEEKGEGQEKGGGPGEGSGEGG